MFPPRFSLSRPSLSISILSVLPLALLAAPALAGPPRVVADIPAVGSLVAQVMGDKGSVHVLLPAGGNAHSYQMRPSDAEALQAADLLVRVGPELTPWLDRAADGLAPANRLDLLALPATHGQEYGATAGHDHEADHAEGEMDHAEEEAGHDHAGTDPHAWLDPANGIAWAGAIADALSTRDPANAAAYAANAEAAIAAIRAADAEAARLLAPVRDRRFVVFHDAYGYFTGHYGLQPAIALSLGDAAPPSAARLAAIRSEIDGAGAACAFPETAHDARPLQTVIEGTNVRLGGALDPSGSGHEGGPGLYPAIITGLAATISACLSGDKAKESGSG